MIINFMFTQANRSKGLRKYLVILINCISIRSLFLSLTLHSTGVLVPKL